MSDLVSEWFEWLSDLVRCILSFNFGAHELYIWGLKRAKKV